MNFKNIILIFIDFFKNTNKKRFIIKFQIKFLFNNDKSKYKIILFMCFDCIRVLIMVYIK